MLQQQQHHHWPQPNPIAQSHVSHIYHCICLMEKRELVFKEANHFLFCFHIFFFPSSLSYSICFHRTQGIVHIDFIFYDFLVSFFSSISPLPQFQVIGIDQISHNLVYMAHQRQHFHAASKYFKYFILHSDFDRSQAADIAFTFSIHLITCLFHLLLLLVHWKLIGVHLCVCMLFIRRLLSNWTCKVDAHFIDKSLFECVHHLKTCRCFTVGGELDSFIHTDAFGHKHTYWMFARYL